tara:strand:+ start:3276 stop:3599 length:324 start_codon:yes stop_codon:yes gene_type:complete
MDFIKNMYEEGLVEKKLDEDAWANIKARKAERLSQDRNIALYGYLVGIENAQRAIRAAELIENGQSVPSTFAKSLAPIIEMIDDFVAAGPGGIARLRQVHKSIKKNR